MDSGRNPDFLSGLDEDTLAALAGAERRIEEMGDGFRAEARLQCQRLRAAVAALGGQEATRPDDGFCQEAFEASHELRGQAGTFGYPLLTEICDSLCDVMERFMAMDREGARDSSLGRKIWSAVVSHADAVATIVDHDLKGQGGEFGRELAAELGRLRAHFDACAA